jgi:hypothetical protein
MPSYNERYAGYKRAVLYFIVFSVYFYLTTDVIFFRPLSFVYFIIGFGLVGAVAALVMLLQEKIEEKLSPKYWLINILIDLLAYGIFTWLFFTLLF